MKKKYSCLFILLCAVLLAAGLSGLAVFAGQKESRFAQIVQDGNVLYTVDLTEKEAQSFEIPYAGHMNRIAVKDGYIYMEEADCPDQLCVKMGELKPGMPIVCLPNHLIIEFAVQENEEIHIQAR